MKVEEYLAKITGVVDGVVEEEEEEDDDTTYELVQTDDDVEQQFDTAIQYLNQALYVLHACQMAMRKGTDLTLVQDKMLEDLLEEIPAFVYFNSSEEEEK